MHARAVPAGTAENGRGEEQTAVTGRQVPAPESKNLKVLILSCNNGSGHNMIAEAVKQCYCEHGDECVIRDGFSFLTEGFSRTVSHLHDFVYRHVPRFYDASFRRTDLNPEVLRKHHPARYLIDLGRFRLGAYIREEGFDQVLCIHVFTAMMLTAAKEQYGLRVRSAILETDHRNTAGCAENDADFHFVPDVSLIPGRRAAGVPESRIVVSGIPVREEIKARTGKEDAKRKLGLDPGRPHILLMGGSMGSGPLRELVRLLPDRLGGDVQLTVLCGSNTRLRRQLTADCRGRKQVRVLGFSEALSLLYDSADLLLTKPGGSTTAEAAVKGLPMVLMDLVGGPESGNISFFLEQGAAVTGKTPEALCTCCGALLQDEAARKAMQCAQQRIASGGASEIIYETMAGTRDAVSAPSHLCCSKG